MHDFAKINLEEMHELGKNNLEEMQEMLYTEKQYKINLIAVKRGRHVF
jgi:hypothetical protein